MRDTQSYRVDTAQPLRYCKAMPSTATKYKPAFTVRKVTSGYTGRESFIVWKRGGGRVSVHAFHSRRAAQFSADELNIGALVLPHADDPRPYDVRRVEAAERYAALTK